MVHHLHHAALDALGGEGEGAEHDEAEVGDRRVGDEPLQVALHRGDDRAVEDADHAEGHQRGREPHRRLGEQVEAEAHEPVGAELQHHAGQDHRAGRGRLGVGVGQPGVQREQRHLHGERHREGEEDPAHRRPVERVGARGVVGEVLRLGDLHQVEVERRVAELLEPGLVLGAGGRVDRRRRRTARPGRPRAMACSIAAASASLSSATPSRWRKARLTMPTSISAEPSIVKMKNFRAAYTRSP